MDIPWFTEEIPYLSTAQMVEVDRVMMDEYKIGLTQMMENAGRCLAHLTRLRFCEGNPREKRISVLAGTGGNGGGALACARRLHNYGARVQVLLTREEERYKGVTGLQLEILRAMNVPIYPAEVVGEVADSELIIDGVIGYNLKGAPRGAAGDLIRWVNQQVVPILALDAPSGVDTTSGRVYDPAIKATATMTLALPKIGLRAPGVEVHVGELYMADISVPPELYAGSALGLEVGPIFAQSDIVRLR